MLRCRYCGKFIAVAGPLRHCRKAGLLCISRPEPIPNPPSIRGRDRAKMDIKWEDPEVLFEQDGKQVVRFHTREDCKQFGRLMGHCAGRDSHFERIKKGDWHFISIITTKDNVPHATIHAKQIELRGTYDGYTGSNARYDQQVSIQNHNCFIVSASVKGGQYGARLVEHKKYGGIFKAWLDHAEPEGAEKIPVGGYY